MGNTGKKFDALVKELTILKVPCNVKYRSKEDEYVIECGSGYPDEIADLASEAAEKAGIQTKNLSICAETSGGIIAKTQMVCGGTKAYWLRTKY